MLLYLYSKDQDEEGNWRYRVTPNPNFPGSLVTRSTDGTWACFCGGCSAKPKIPWMAMPGTPMPCDYMGIAFADYLVTLARISKMTAASKIQAEAHKMEMERTRIETMERVQRQKEENEQRRAIEEKTRLVIPATTLALDAKRVIKLED